MSKWFDPEKAFFKLPIVRLTAGALFLGIVASILCIISASDLQFDRSYKGFNQFIEYFKFPIGLLAFLIPLGAIYATNHRSEQFKKQMEVAKNQNNFSNYYKHIEEFEKYISDHINEVNKVEVTQIRALHNEIFNKASEGDFAISGKVNEQLNQAAISIIQKLKRIDKEVVETPNFKREFIIISRLASMMLKSFKVRYKTKWGWGKAKSEKRN